MLALPRANGRKAALDPRRAFPLGWCNCTGPRPPLAFLGQKSVRPDRARHWRALPHWRCPALPCPALALALPACLPSPCPALPCPALPCLPRLPALLGNKPSDADALALALALP